MASRDGIRRRVSCAGLLVTAALGASTIAAAPQGAEGAPEPPKLVIEESTIELGAIIRGQPVQATFAIRNDGGDTLRILKAKPG